MKAEKNEFTDIEVNESGSNKDGENGPNKGEETESSETEERDEMNTFENLGNIKGEEERSKITGQGTDEIENDGKIKTPDKQAIEKIKDIHELEGGERAKIKFKVKVSKVTGETNKTPDIGQIDKKEIEKEIEETKIKEGGDKKTVNEDEKTVNEVEKTVNEVVDEHIHDNADLEEYNKVEEIGQLPKCGLMTCPLEAKYCKVETKSVPPDFSQVLKSFECLSTTHEVLKAIQTLIENSEPGRYFKNFTTQPVVLDNQISTNLGDFWGQ